MKKLLLLFVSLCIASTVQAGVRPLGDADDVVRSKSSSSSSYNKDRNLTSQPVVSIKSINTAQRCEKGGFTMKECPSGYIAVYPCPEDKKYFRDCCPQQYRYTEAECRQKGLEPSEETCLIFHACRKKEIKQQTTEQKHSNKMN